MRELKGDWRDLFNGFMLALDLRKMFLAFAGIVFTVLVAGGFTLFVGGLADKAMIHEPASMAPHELWRTLESCWDLIFFGEGRDSLGRGTTYDAHWYVYVPYAVGFLLILFAIWGYFGGAIARIAAYEIAKDGERIETTRAMKFSGHKFWSYFFAPIICVMGFLFFFCCNLIFGFIGQFLDFLFIGGPLLAILLPLAILSGFIMMLIVVGTLAGSPLFAPAVAAEGTDSFDAVSRGFSYVYSRPWQYIGYQIITVVYGAICVAFVYLFAVGMTDVGVRAGTAGFDSLNVMWTDDKEQGYTFNDIRGVAWTRVLSRDHDPSAALYSWNPYDMAMQPHPYGRTMFLANRIVRPDFERIQMIKEKGTTTFHFDLVGWIVTVWLIVVLGHAYGYGISYLISQQTMIYYILRKRVDGIEMNEVFEEAEEEEVLPEPPPPAGEEKPEQPEAEKKAPSKTTRGTRRRTPSKRSRRKKS